MDYDKANIFHANSQLFVNKTQNTVFYMKKPQQNSATSD